MFFADLLTFESPKIGTSGKEGRKVGEREGSLFFSGSLINLGAFAERYWGKQKMDVMILSWADGEESRKWGCRAWGLQLSTC